MCHCLTTFLPTLKTRDFYFVVHLMSPVTGFCLFFSIFVLKSSGPVQAEDTCTLSSFVRVIQLYQGKMGHFKHPKWEL